MSHQHLITPAFPLLISHTPTPHTHKHSRTHTHTHALIHTQDACNQLKNLSTASPAVKLFAQWCERAPVDPLWRGRFKVSGGRGGEGRAMKGLRGETDGRVEG
jgi:hypothetical protein